MSSSKFGFLNKKPEKMEDPVSKNSDPFSSSNKEAPPLFSGMSLKAKGQSAKNKGIGMELSNMDSTNKKKDAINENELKLEGKKIDLNNNKDDKEDVKGNGSNEVSKNDLVPHQMIKEGLEMKDNFLVKRKDEAISQECKINQSNKSEEIAGLRIIKSNEQNQKGNEKSPIAFTLDKVKANPEELLEFVKMKIDYFNKNIVNYISEQHKILNLIKEEKTKISDHKQKIDGDNKKIVEFASQEKFGEAEILQKKIAEDSKKIKFIEEQIKQQQDSLTTLNFKKMEEDKQKQNLIESIINEVENQTKYSQKKFDDFSVHSLEQRKNEDEQIIKMKQTLEKITSDLGKCNEEIKEKENSLDNSISLVCSDFLIEKAKAEGQLKDIENEIVVLKAKILELETQKYLKMNDLKKIEDDITAGKEKFRDKFQELESMKERSLEIFKEQSTNQDSLNNFEINSEKANKERNTLFNKMKVSVESFHNLCKNLSTLITNISTLNEEEKKFQDSIVNSQKELYNIELKLFSLNSKREYNNEKLKQNELKLSEQLTNQTNLKNLLDKLEEEKKEFAKLWKFKEAQKSTEEIKKNKIIYDNLEKQIAESKSSIESFQEQEKQLILQSKESIELKEKNQLDNFISKSQLYKIQLKKIEELENDVSKKENKEIIEKEKERLISEIEELEKILKVNSFENEAFENLIEDAKKFADSINQLETKINLAVQKEEFNEAEIEKEKLDIEIKKFEKLKEILRSKYLSQLNDELLSCLKLTKNESEIAPPSSSSNLEVKK